MGFTITRDRNKTQARITGDKGNLIGLITTTENQGLSAVHRIELLMKIDHKIQGDFEEAVAFVRGAEHALRIFKVIRNEEK